MLGNVVVTQSVKDAVISSLPALGDQFDGPPKVSLLTADFSPGDPGTWGVVSPVVAAINGTTATAWEPMFDAVESNWKLVAPEPAGGWDFVSSGAGDSITGFKVELASDVANKIGAIRFENPIPIPSTGIHIMVPYVAIPLGSLFEGATNPFPFD